MSKHVISDFDGEIINAIKEKYGSPVYIFDEESFISNFLSLQNAFSKYYPKYRIAYSYKTNYTPYIGRLVYRLGALAEVVSDFELYTALKNGNEYSNIIYNGPLKQESLNDFVLSGGVLNIDNLQECERVAKIAKENPSKEIKVGIRVNIDIGQNFVSRFGLEPNSEDFAKALAVLRGSKNIYFIGLHCHVGQSRNIHNWRRRVSIMLELADTLFKDNNVGYIDLGSGMFGDMDIDLKAQFGECVPDYEDYASVVAKVFSEHYKNYDYAEKPFLYTEPGATVVSRYMWLVTSITSHKNVRGRILTGVDSSFFNAGETSRYKQLPIRVFSKNREFKIGDIVGYTCLEDDCLFTNCSEKASIGDTILFGNTGGYSVVFKPPFILPDIPIVVLKNGNVFELIKEKQSYDNMLELYL